MGDWNSDQYAKFLSERTQPSTDLINRIKIEPNTILDIGCGPGNSTRKLFDRFPDAKIFGIDSSENMLKKARQNYPDIEFEKCSVPEGLDEIKNVDLIFSNACLHWIPNHKALLPKLINKLNDNGILAVQMPLVQYADFYKILNELVSESKWVKLQEIKNFHNLLPEETYDILAEVSSNVTMWETTYYHIVPEFQSVIDWYKGSGLRPYLERLNENEQNEFLDELLCRIKDNYTIRKDNNVILKMPRLFFIANK